MVDYRVEFTKWWTTEFKTIKFPHQGTVFDYFIDPETKKFEPWSKKTEKFELDPDMPLQVNIFTLIFIKNNNIKKTRLKVATKRASPVSAKALPLRHLGPCNGHQKHGMALSKDM